MCHISETCDRYERLIQELPGDDEVDASLRSQLAATVKALDEKRRRMAEDEPF